MPAEANRPDIMAADLAAWRQQLKEEDSDEEGGNYLPGDFSIQPPADMDLVDPPPSIDDEDAPSVVQQHHLIRPAVEHDTTDLLFPDPRDVAVTPTIDPAQNADDGGTYTSHDDSDGGRGYDDSDGGGSRSADNGGDVANATDKDDGDPMCDVIPNLCRPYARTDPRWAIDPGDYEGTAFLILDRLPTGEVPPGPDGGAPFTLTQPFTDPSNKYITQTCVVCTLLPAGYAVYRTVPPVTELDETTSDYTAHCLLQRNLCYEGYWIVDMHGRGRHSRYFWASKL